MRLMVWLLMFGLAGCVTQSNRPDAASRGAASAKVHTELASLYFERGQYGIALEETAVAIRSYDDYAPAYTMRALIQMALHEDKEAESNFQHSLKLDANSSEAHNNYGWFLCQRGREKESIAEFRAAMKNPLYETPEKALVNAGLCSHKIRDDQAAEDFLQRALMVRPRLPEALIALAELDFDRGDWAGAKSHFMQFEQVAPDALTAANLWLAVRIERKLARGEMAESYAQQLRQRYPDARETQLMLYGQ